MGKTLRRDKAITKGVGKGDRRKPKCLKLLLAFRSCFAPRLSTSLSAFGVSPKAREKGLQRLHKDKDKMCPPNSTCAGFALEVSRSSWLPFAGCGSRFSFRLGGGMG